MRGGLIGLCVLGAAACGTPTPEAPSQDSGGGEEDVENPEWCDTASPAGWDDFGEGFLLTHCQPCHASNSANRYGAPEAISFDTESAALEQSEAILRTVLEQPSMPPAGGITEDEATLLRHWLICD